MTSHKIYFQSSAKMDSLACNSVDLVVTSPPYPMISMWDDIFTWQNPVIGECLETKPNVAFELMHQELDKVWKNCFRVLKEGGFLCINIGDATRTTKGNFQLHNNHSRIINSCTEIGFINLPNIIWRKQTNSPNKFMGSGMLPCGAYVTLEHEWILIFRKGVKRIYKKEEEKQLRRRSSFFWEERNQWFSDVWEIKGTKQKIVNSGSRERNASFPIEIPYRLINMYSQQNDIVLDPFLGLGTTSIAAMISERNSIGFEIDAALSKNIQDYITSFIPKDMNDIMYGRYRKHLDFVKERKSQGKEMKYHNMLIDCDVMTGQETDLSFHYVTHIVRDKDPVDTLCFSCEYSKETDMENVFL